MFRFSSIDCDWFLIFMFGSLLVVASIIGDSFRSLLRTELESRLDIFSGTLEGKDFGSLLKDEKVGWLSVLWLKNNVLAGTCGGVRPLDT